LALTCSIIICADRARARQLLRVVAWSGAAYAIFGIASYLIDPTKILWRDKQGYATALTSTFVNRNTAAIYFGSCSIVWLLLIVEQIQQLLPPPETSWKETAQGVVSGLSRQTALWLVMLIVCLAAMLMTQSRAGVILSLAGLVIAFSAFVMRRASKRSGVIVAVLISVAVALLALQILGGGTGARIDIEGLADRGRLETYRSVLRMIADHPWLGT